MIEQRPRPVLIDARMLFHTGIGNFLRNVLLRRPQDVPAEDLEILVSNQVGMEWAAKHLPGAKIRLWSAPIYGVRSQLLAARSFWGASSPLLWVPHYNVPLAWRGPLLTTVHDAIPLALPELFSPLARLYAKLEYWAVARKSRRVLCNSNFTVGEFIRYTGCEASKVEGRLLGLDPWWFEGTRSSSAARTDPPYIVFVGNVRPLKNLANLILAFRQLRARRRVELKIVGNEKGFISGAGEGSRLRDLDCEGVHFTGYLSNDELRATLDNAEILVMPSLYEGFGLPSIEGMARGCLVAVSDIPVFREVCGPHASYFDQKDPTSIARVLEDLLDIPQAEKTERRQRALEAARAMTWDAIAQLHWREIHRLMPRAASSIPET